MRLKISGWLSFCLLMVAMSQTAVAKTGIRPVDNQAFIDECGACHYAYPPGLLPSRSWQELVSNLENHFGEDADVEKGLKQTLLDYMMTYGASITSEYGRERTIAKSLGPRDVPVRITELKYFRHEHRELTRDMVESNDKVRGLANCNTCHTKIDAGRFEEDDIIIPGFGRWED